MQFNINNLKELLTSVKDNNLRSISVTENRFELIVNKELIHRKQKILKRNQNINLSKSTAKQGSTIRSNYLKPKTVNSPVSSKESEIYFTIVSPMVGTFYRSPGPSEPYFIELHDHVKVNETVCIVEAMKLMNEIEAEINGEIVEILVKDGDIVDCGQPLIKIKPDKIS
uniref:Acetyl-CoA carboxylase, biotin carboxyl carrier protein n=1 Tax=Nemalion vermiculare TaxID=935621 RepID=UPI00257D7F48|nr:Acetyl-CoA carboxylase, biotin carboxyl carrier protein [Nemalion vermiculare]WGV34402.1 Acetyl-CoA carboxylase, biotin carboxyl carrier protein [Nemalion vermiculare]